jgi:Cu+-exporting ATPase
MQKTNFKILGMNCKSCAKIIEYGLVEKDGIESVSVNFENQNIFLEFNPLKTDENEIKNDIKNLGYKAIKE